MRQFNIGMYWTTPVDPDLNLVFLHEFLCDYEASVICDDLNVLDMTGNIDAFRP